MKFVAGPPFAYYEDRYDFTFFETVLFCVIGGMLGVAVFTFFSIEIQIFVSWIKRQWKKAIRKPQIFSKPVTTEDNLEINYELVYEDEKKKVFSQNCLIKVTNEYSIQKMSKNYDKLFQELLNV